jgi:hypothetical protein
MSEQQENDKRQVQELDEVTGAVKAGGIEHLDFVTALVLMLVCVGSGSLAIRYYLKSKTEFYASPGFMPMIITGILFLLSVSLMAQSLKGGKAGDLFQKAMRAIPAGVKSKRFINSVIGLAMFAVYVFVFLKFLPFWLSSLILLFAVFAYLKAAKLWLCAVISILAIGGIVLLFQIAFRVPMP